MSILPKPVEEVIQEGSDRIADQLLRHLFRVVLPPLLLELCAFVPGHYRSESHDDITRLPTVPPSPIWQGDDVEYEVIEIDQSDQSISRGQLQRAHRTGPIYRAPARAHPAPACALVDPIDICEQATKPPPVPFQPHSMLALDDEPSFIHEIVEADTVMDDTLIVVPSLPPDIDGYPTQVEDVVDVALTLRARELLSHKGTPVTGPAFIHNPVDYLRWWLLRPGRLEFLFWLIGAIILATIMCVLLVVTGLGLGWMSFGHGAH